MTGVDLVTPYIITLLNDRGEIDCDADQLHIEGGALILLRDAVPVRVSTT
jgi:hypothetical protein